MVNFYTKSLCKDENAENKNVFYRWQNLEGILLYRALFGLQASEQTNKNYTIIQSLTLSVPTCDVTMRNVPVIDFSAVRRGQVKWERI